MGLGIRVKLDRLVDAFKALEEAFTLLAEAMREVAQIIRVTFAILRHRSRRPARDWNRRPPIIHNGRKPRQ